MGRKIGLVADCKRVLISAPIALAGVLSFSLASLAMAWPSNWDSLNFLTSSGSHFAGQMSIRRGNG